MKKFLSLFMCACLLAGCTSTPKEETNTETPVEENNTEANNTEEKEIATTGKYVITNTTGETITELYLYKTDSSEKGDNYANEGLADGESVTIEVEVSKEEAEGYAQTLEYVTESGRVENGFKTLHLEEANINLLAADADTYTSATPFSWGF